MKYLRSVIMAFGILIVFLAAVFWFLYFTDRVVLLNLIMFQSNINHVPAPSNPARTAPPPAKGGNSISNPVISSSSASGRVDDQNISRSDYWHHVAIFFASSTAQAEFKKIEKVDFLKYLSHEFETATGQSEYEACEASSTYLDSIAYGDLTGDRAEEAVVRFTTCRNGTGGGFSGVYTLDDKGNILEITPDLSKYSFYENLFKGYEGHGYFDLDKSGELIYGFPVYNEGDSNAGPTGGGITIFLKWDGKNFIFVKSVFDPAAYGNQQAINQSSTSSPAASQKIKNPYGPEEFSTSTSIFSSSTPDRQWLTCTDKGLGFSIDFPKGVDVMPAYRRINFGSATGKFPWYSAVSVQGEGQTVDQFFKSASSRVAPADKLVLDSRLIIDHEPALLYHESGSEADIKRTAIVSHNNQMFVIDLNFTDSTTTNIILNSFRFLK